MGNVQQHYDDLLAEHYTFRVGDGWEVHKSSYPKLRLDPAWLADQLSAAGLHVDHHQLGPNRMWATAARKTPAPPRQ